MNKVYTNVYDPKNVSVIVAGIPMSGYADGDMITIEPVTKENMKSHAGVDGDVSFTKVNDPRRTVTLRLKPSSPSNIVLEGLLLSPALFPIAVINKKGGAYTGGASKCVIAEKPTVAFGAEEKMKEWKILAGDFDGIQLPE